MSEVSSVLIMSEGGLPLLYQKINPKSADMDPSLLSGFLQALEIFGDQTINPDRRAEDKQTAIDYGRRKLLLYRENPITVVAIHESQMADVDSLSSKIRQVARLFVARFRDELSRSLQATSLFEPFKEELVELFVEPLVSSWWVPKPINPPTVDDKLTLFDEVDGERSVQDICDASGSGEADVKKQLYLWWTKGYIEFKNVLAGSDILIPRKSAQAFLAAEDIFATFEVDPSSCPITPESTISCKEIIKRLDGKTSVQQLDNEHHCKPQIECLWEKGFVEVLSAEKRRILLAKEVTSKIVQAMRKHFKKKEVAALVQEATNKANSLEIFADLQILGEEVVINFQFRNYDNFPPNELQAIYEKWIEFNKSIITLVPTKKMRKVVDELVVQLDPAFFDGFRAEDFEDFDEFTFAIESALA